MRVHSMLYVFPVHSYSIDGIRENTRSVRKVIMLIGLNIRLLFAMRIHKFVVPVRAVINCSSLLQDAAQTRRRTMYVNMSISIPPLTSARIACV